MNGFTDIAEVSRWCIARNSPNRLLLEMLSIVGRILLILLLRSHLLLLLLLPFVVSRCGLLLLVVSLLVVSSIDL